MSRSGVSGHSRIALAVAMLAGTAGIAVAQDQQGQPPNGHSAAPLTPVQSMRSTDVPFAGTCYARSVYLVVDEHGGGSAPIITRPGEATLISLDDGIQFDWGAIVHKQFWFRRVGKDLAVIPKNWAKPGTISNAVVRTNKFPLSLRLSVASEATQSTDLVYVTTRTRREMCEQELSVPLARLVAVEEENTGLRSDLVEMQEQCVLNERKAELREALARLEYRTLYPLPRATPTESISVHLMRAEIRPGGRGAMIFFTVDNRENKPFPLTSMLASNHEMQDRPVQLALLDLARPEDDDQQLIASIPPKTTARGVLVLPFDMDDSSQPLRLEFLSANGGKALAAATDRWVMRPMTDEEYQQEEWEKEQAEKLAKRYRQQSVNLRLVAGAVWIGDGVGDSRLDATSLAGFAVRFQKGYANSLALEGEVMAARTGDAIFDDIALDGTMGELTRRATLARVELGIAARLGYKVIFTPRVALALQMARFEADFAADGGGSGMAPDSSFEFVPTLTFGASVHTHLSDGFVLGATLSADGLGISENKLYQNSLNAGLHLGYGWEPVPKKRPTTPTQP